MSDLMTLNVTAHCENCKTKQPLNVHGRCSVCGSDSVDYSKPRDAQTSMRRAIYRLTQELAEMELK